MANGYRSGLEERIAEELAAKGIHVTFEGAKAYYTPPIKTRSYTTDFPLPNGIWVETKGRFTTDDRQKHKAIKTEHPDLDIRFVFSNSNARLSKGSKTTYGMWCVQYGFPFADKSVPQAWLDEPTCSKRWAAIERAGRKTS
ncbi:hypothetical protein [Aquibium microcysteis]|uniref:hypothetical protein n=1 Tax=Aquibium microcysteis TaxID=675281 RepID=UPI001AEDDBEC|nr:hypothetical protein [Aquibium microcysteis]